MKSTAGKELQEKIKILEKVSTTFKQFDDELKEVRSSHNIEKVKIIIEKSAKAQQVAAHIKKTIAPISKSLEKWLMDLKVKFSESNKYHEMIERLTCFQSIDGELEDLEDICLPKTGEIPDDVDLFEEFIEDLDNIIYDMMLFTDDALSDLNYIQDGNQTL